MIILDTNVLSALMQKTPESRVIRWLDKQPRISVWITSVTVLEVNYGLKILPTGKRRSQLIDAFAAVIDQIENRIVPFDSASAELSAELMAARHRAGRPVELRDTMIAGIVLCHHATLVTRNTSHFQDLNVTLINPWAP